MTIPFIDLKAQQKLIKPQIDEAIARVLEHGKYIMGPEVAQLEKDLCAFSGAKYCVSCSSGTDALSLILMAWNIGPGDAVFVPTFTFVASAEVVALLGATPVFVDVDEDTFNISEDSLQKAISFARQKDLTPKVVMPVDLFGQPADYKAIEPIAKEHNLKILCDAAQSFGGSYQGQRVGTFGDATATSFFPAKPLGCYGDGGAVFTNDEEFFNILKSLRIHGKGTDKYDNVRIGLNARLDTIQAAILIEKLKIFETELSARDKVAHYYSAALNDICAVPVLMEQTQSAWAQYTIKVNDRSTIQKACADADIPSVIYYPRPLHMQTGYQKFGVMEGGLPVSEKLSEAVLSLPMHPYLEKTQQDQIISVLRSTLETKAA